jgi:hypothetical protein
LSAGDDEMFYTNYFNREVQDIVTLVVKEETGGDYGDYVIGGCQGQMKKYRCHLCGMEYQWSDRYRRHMKAHQTFAAGKNYGCRVSVCRFFVVFFFFFYLLSEYLKL